MKQVSIDTISSARIRITDDASSNEEIEARFELNDRFHGSTYSDPNDYQDSID